MSKIQQNPFFMEFVSNFLSAENCKRTTKKHFNRNATGKKI